MLTISAILYCQFVFADNKGNPDYGMLFNFLLFEKMDRRNCIKFCVKNVKRNEINTRILEILTVALGESTVSKTQVQLV